MNQTGHIVNVAFRFFLSPLSLLFTSLSSLSPLLFSLCSLLSFCSFSRPPLAVPTFRRYGRSRAAFRRYGGCGHTKLQQAVLSTPTHTEGSLASYRTILVRCPTSNPPGAGMHRSKTMNVAPTRWMSSTVAPTLVAWPTPVQTHF